MNDIVAVNVVLGVNVIVVCTVVDCLVYFILLMLLFSIFQKKRRIIRQSAKIISGRLYFESPSVLARPL